MSWGRDAWGRDEVGGLGRGQVQQEGGGKEQSLSSLVQSPLLASAAT